MKYYIWSHRHDQVEGSIPSLGIMDKILVEATDQFGNSLGKFVAETNFSEWRGLHGTGSIIEHDIYEMTAREKYEYNYTRIFGDKNASRRDNEKVQEEVAAELETLRRL
jgi:hypothetical protein